jgi:hypothetical protein
MHTADDTRGRVRRRRRGGGQWRGQEAQAPGVPARRPFPCARAAMRERRRPTRLSPGSGPLSALPAVNALHALRIHYAHDIAMPTGCMLGGEAESYIPNCVYRGIRVCVLCVYIYIYIYIYALTPTRILQTRTLTPGKHLRARKHTYARVSARLKRTVVSARGHFSRAGPEKPGRPG